MIEYNYFFYVFRKINNRVFINITEDLSEKLDVLYLWVRQNLWNLSNKSIFLDINSLLDYIKGLLITIDERIKQVMKNFQAGSYEDSKIEVLAWYIIFRIFGLESLYPLIADPLVQEIYIIEHHNIYVDHVIWGRIDVNLFASEDLVNKLIFFLKLYANLSLLGEASSAKIEFDVLYSKLRISVDRSESIYFLDIRKAKVLLPLYWLIAELEDKFPLAWLLSLLIIRPNIIIFGETGSGKTTLAKFLLSILPKNWRVALIEDIAEIPLELLRSKYFRILVDPYEKRVSPFYDVALRKSNEILKLLHRMPDYMYVSEIQDREDSWALMMALNASLRGMATIHASNIDELINRLCGIYGLEKELVSVVDIFIEMKRIIKPNEIKRTMASIYVVFNDELNKLLAGYENSLLSKNIICGQKRMILLPVVVNTKMVVDKEFLMELAHYLITKYLKAMHSDYHAMMRKAVSGVIYELEMILSNIDIRFSRMEYTLVRKNIWKMISDLRNTIDGFYRRITSQGVRGDSI